MAEALCSPAFQLVRIYWEKAADLISVHWARMRLIDEHSMR